MDPAHFRDKGIDWWRREGSSPHDSFVLPVLRGPAIQSVLDVGIGRGALTFRIRDLEKRVVGLEINPGFIRYCRDRAGSRDIGFVQGNAEVLPFRNETFDAVVCIEVLTHLPHPAKAIAEMSRIAKRGGIVVVSYLAKYTGAYFKRVFTVATGMYERRYGPRSFDYRFDSLRDFRRYARGTGLTVVEVARTAYWAPCVLLKKT